jgi:hypothetical protein
MIAIIIKTMTEIGIKTTITIDLEIMIASLINA